MPVHDVAKTQQRTAEACDMIIGSAQTIIREGNVAICISLSTRYPPSFVSVTFVLIFCNNGISICLFIFATLRHRLSNIVAK
jgi:hypothetical protein